MIATHIKPKHQMGSIDRRHIRSRHVGGIERKQLDVKTHVTVTSTKTMSDAKRPTTWDLHASTATMNSKYTSLQPLVPKHEHVYKWHIGT
jgi:hypothetical protein